MCGISGFLNRDPAQPAGRDLIARMTEVIAHRGPDGSGLHVDGPVALGTGGSRSSTCPPPAPSR